MNTASSLRTIISYNGFGAITGQVLSDFLIVHYMIALFSINIVLNAVFPAQL